MLGATIKITKSILLHNSKGSYINSSVSRLQNEDVLGKMASTAA